MLLVLYVFLKFVVMVLHTAVLPEACVVSSITGILWRFRWSSCVYWYGIQVLFTEVAEVNDYCLLLPSIFNNFFFSRTSHVAVDMLQDDWDWSEKFSSNISTRRLGTKGSHTPHDYTWEPHQETMLGNLANISFSPCSTVLTILNVLPVVSYPLFIFADGWEDPSNATNIFSWFYQEV